MYQIHSTVNPENNYFLGQVGSFEKKPSCPIQDFFVANPDIAEKATILGPWSQTIPILEVDEEGQPTGHFLLFPKAVYESLIVSKESTCRHEGLIIYLQKIDDEYVAVAAPDNEVVDIKYEETEG